MVTMLVVTVGIRGIDLDCWTFDRWVLKSDMREMCCQTVSAIMSDTARPGSCRDKWLIHFRLHV